MAASNLANLLDPQREHNFLFIASVIAVLCENSPITVSLADIEKYWDGDISRLQYDMAVNANVKDGVITFSLKDKE